MGLNGVVMITKQFDRHLKYYTTINKVFANGVILITAYYLVFNLPVGYLIGLYIIMFVIWLLVSLFFIGRFLDFIIKMNLEEKEKAKFDIITNICDVVINASCYGIIVLILFSLYKNLVPTYAMLGIGLLMAGAIIIYLLSEYMTKKLIRRL
jgi:hypothetical protein